MTKEQYFEMCETLGSTPKEEEIPIEINDLPYEVVDAFKVYDYLQDNWDYFNGDYQGKIFTGIKDIVDMCGIPTELHEITFEYINKIDAFRIKRLRDKKPRSPKKPA